MLYGKGGWAWVGTNNSNFPTAGGGSLAMSGTGNTNGWTAGLGVEWAFSGNWSARAEYDYIGLTKSELLGYRPRRRTLDTISANSRSIQLVTAGVNYKFGWGGGGFW
jgi:opacity protein-like surface antigen